MVSLKVNYAEEVFETESYKGRGSEEDIDNASVGDGKKKTAKVTDTCVSVSMRKSWLTVTHFDSPVFFVLFSV